MNTLPLIWGSRDSIQHPSPSEAMESNWQYSRSYLQIAFAKILCPTLALQKGKGMYLYDPA